ncbi:MAG: FHA domain-containing protein [Anaerolineales bacterium]|nr:FHA domain-containing protein [Anaerolineales bacterium]
MMARISRLFGRKDDDQSSGAGSPEDGGQVPAGMGAAEDTPDASDLVFGLKFTFEAGESKTFTTLPISIGRSEQNDIVLGDKSVSAFHARIYYDERVRGVCIVDSDSLNGIFINDRPTRRNMLQDGVKVRLGNVSLVFRDTGYIHSGSD